MFVEILGLEFPRHWLEWEYLTDAHKRLLLVCSRDHGKTTFLEGLTLIRCAQKPNYEVCLISYSDKQVNKMVSHITNWIDTKSTISGLRPQSRSTTWSKTSLTFPETNAHLDTLSFGASGRGGHYDLVIVDDPVKDFSGMNADDQEQYFRNAITPMVKPDGQMIVAGNYVYQNDLIERLEKNAAYKKAIYPAIDNGVALWPSRWPLDKLKERALEVGEYSFNREYLLQKIDPATQFFKKHWFQMYTQLPGRFCKVLSLDPAITTNGDYTAMVLTGTTEENKTYVLDHANIKTDNVQKIIDTLFGMVETWQVPFVIVEAIGFQRLLKFWIYEEMRKRNTYFGVHEIKSYSKTKEARIMQLQPRIQSGGLLFREGQEDIIEQFQVFPRGTNDDLCFVAGTKIATEFGDKNIEDVKEGDRVITPFGLRDVLDSKFTGIRPTMKSPVAPLEGTANHPIYTKENGFTRMDGLTIQLGYDKIGLWNNINWMYRKLLSSMMSNSDSWGRENIISASRIQLQGGNHLKDFMWRCGNFITNGKLAKAFTFTTKTATLLTTALKIWSVYRLSNTWRCLRILIETKCANILHQLGRLPVNGTPQKKAGNGTKNTLERFGPIPNGSLAFASNAGRVSNPSIQMQNSVVAVATKKQEPSSGGVLFAERFLQPINTANRPIALQNAGQPKAVYNLCVDKDHVYYANGILVSNCDALSMQVDFWEKPDKVFEGAPNNSWDWWADQLQGKEEGWRANLFSDFSRPDSPSGLHLLNHD